MQRKGIKPSDTNDTVTLNSRADKYAQRNGLTDYMPLIRPNLPIKTSENNSEKILSQFNIKAIGFGNWVTVEDRLNYLNCLYLALYDLNKVCGFNRNMGFGALSVAFGARGSGRALAHYEPLVNVINITRYKRGGDKDEMFITSGGIHSFAHEYGHFLDYYTSFNILKQSGAISGGSSTGHSPEGGKTDFNKVMDKILYNIQHSKNGDVSKYLIRLQKTGAGVYWFRRNELFARAFEVYVSNFLNTNGIKNIFLAKPKYNKSYYLNSEEIKPLIPLFDQLLKLIKTKISK